jgi:hypothetical protein
LRPSYFWTWRLLADGYSAEQCAAIRRLQPDEVLDHALRAAEDGLHVDCHWLLSSIQLGTLKELVDSQPPQRRYDLVAQLPKGLRSEHLLLYLKCRSSTDESGK